MLMTALGWVAMVLAGLTALALVSRRLLDNPRDDVETGLFWHLSRLYGAWVHRLRIDGKEHIPSARHPGPLIVVANHASGVDPVLVQAACPFEIRWLMSQEMRHPAGEWFWQWGRVIFVGGDRAGAAGTREALRYLRDGGVLGIFPEGGIERPPRQIRPFLAGVGYIVKKSGAPVLPIVVTGVPEIDPVWHALVTRSESVVAAKTPIDYANTSLDAAAISQDLRRKFMAWTGWPANDEGGAPLAEDPPAAMPFPRADHLGQRRRAGA